MNDPVFIYEIKPIKVKANLKIVQTIDKIITDLILFDTNNSLTALRKVHLERAVDELKTAVSSYDRTFIVNPKDNRRKVILSLPRLISGLENEITFMKNINGYQTNDLTKIWIKQLAILAEAFSSPKRNNFRFAEPIINKQVIFPSKPTVKKVPIVHSIRREKIAFEQINSIYEDYTGRQGFYLNKKGKREAELDSDINLTASEQPTTSSSGRTAYKRATIPSLNGNMFIF